MTLGLAQRPGTIAFTDLFCREEAPFLEEEAANHSVIFKCVVNTGVPLERQIELFLPDRLVLVTRNIDDIAQSLNGKKYRVPGGSLEEKLEIYQSTVSRNLPHFDKVVSFERFSAYAPTFLRSVREVIEFTNSRSTWCSENYGQKRGLGGLQA